MPSKSYRLLVILTSIGMLFVILAGALVTNTGSGEGCGTDWPLCHGKFVPAYAIESLIEYSHRFITGVEGLLVFIVFLWTLVRYRENKAPVIYASATLFFTLLQAFLGALAVIYPTSPQVMALHFGFSILGFTSTWLLVMWTRRMMKSPANAVNRIKVPPRLFGWSLTILIFSYVVIYLGAYVRHKGFSGACVGWPLCNGQIIPDFNEATMIVIAHRLGALILAALVIYVWSIVRKTDLIDGVLDRLSWAMLLLITAQILSGAFLTYTIANEDLSLFSRMLHGFIVSIFYAVSVDFTIRAFPRKK